MTLDDRLAALAAAGGTITYGALARELGLRMADLTAALEAGMRADHAQGRPFRAAVCRARMGDGLPARGFFDMLAEMGVEVGDPAALVAAERQALRSVAGALPPAPPGYLREDKGA
jgi:hypothetical protein